ncbi:MAG: DeoR family transcriptional regulator [Chitinophagales bacterium]
MMKTKDKVLKLLQKHGQLSVHELSILLKVSRQYIHRILLELEEDNSIVKIGISPKVFYKINTSQIENQLFTVDYEKEQFLKKHFLVIDALGNMLEGLDGMIYWCEKQQLNVEKTINEYILTRNKYLQYYNNNSLINGIEKLKNTKGINQIGVDELYYLDFYAIERFGKTRLGTLMHYAKQGQSRPLMKLIVSEIKQRIYKIIKDENIDAVVYVPPTISRKVQIMTELKKMLNIDLPEVKVDKIKTSIIIPQKALSKIFERIANAKNTFIVPQQRKYKHILIIDDAIGSGATINEIAIKIKEKKIAKKITGLAITGSYKGFEVISEI